MRFNVSTSSIRTFDGNIYNATEFPNINQIFLQRRLARNDRRKRESTNALVMLPIDSLFIGGALDKGLELFIQLYHDVRAFRETQMEVIQDSWIGRQKRLAYLANSYVSFASPAHSV
jgi:hypothetical protein